MTRETMEIGPVPADEPCANVGEEGYYERAMAECHAFVGLIRRALGVEPVGARLTVKANPHDFGTYHEVAVLFDSDNDAAAAYAYRVESEAPAVWDDQARAELRAAGALR